MPAGSAIRAGQVFVEIFAKDRAVMRTLSKVERRLKRFGISVSNIGRRMFGLSAGIGALFIHPIAAASKLQETLAKFNTVFGGNSQEVRKWGEEFGKTVGRSKEQVLSFLAGSQDLFVPLGIDPQSASEMSKTLTSLAVDLASFNNKSDEVVMRDLQAAMTGSSETMKKYGVIVNQAAVKQELLNQSINPKSATEAEKAMARLQIILRGTTQAQGDAIRTSGSFANQIKRMKSEFTDASAALGSAILPVLTKVVTLIAKVISKVSEYAAKNPELVKAVFLSVAAFGALSIAIIAVGAVITGLGAIIGLIKVTLAVLLSPITLIIGGIAAIAFATGALDGPIKSAKKGFSSLADTAKTTFGGIAKALKAGEIGKAWDILVLGLKIIWAKFTGFLGNKWDMVLFSIKSVALTIFRGIVLIIQNALQSIVDLLLTAAQKLNDLADFAVPDGLIDSLQSASDGISNFTDSFKRGTDIKQGEFGQTVIDNEKARALAVKNLKDQQKALINSIAEANSATGSGKTTDNSNKGHPSLNLLKRNLAQIGGPSFGTFNAAAARLGVGRESGQIVEKKQLKEIEKLNKKTDETNQHLEEVAQNTKGLVFG